MVWGDIFDGMSYYVMNTASSHDACQLSNKTFICTLTNKNRHVDASQEVSSACVEKANAYKLDKNHLINYVIMHAKLC